MKKFILFISFVIMLLNSILWGDENQITLSMPKYRWLLLSHSSGYYNSGQLIVYFTKKEASIKTAFLVCEVRVKESESDSLGSISGITKVNLDMNYGALTTAWICSDSYVYIAPIMKIYLTDKEQHGTIISNVFKIPIALDNKIAFLYRQKLGPQLISKLNKESQETDAIKAIEIVEALDWQQELAKLDTMNIRQDFNPLPLSQQEAFDFLQQLNNEGKMVPPIYGTAIYKKLSKNNCFGIRLNNGKRIIGECAGKDYGHYLTSTTIPIKTTALQIGFLYSEIALVHSDQFIPKGSYEVYAGPNKLTLMTGRQGSQNIPEIQTYEITLNSPLPQSMLESKTSPRYTLIRQDEYTIAIELGTNQIPFMLSDELDFRATWQEINDGLTSTYATCLISLSENILLAGTNGSGIFRSEDGGYHWSRTTPLLENNWINCFARTQTDTILAGTENGLYYSEDDGKTWQKYNLELAQYAWISSIAIDENNSIYIGTHRKGILRSLDNGKTWEFMNNGLKADADCESILIHPDHTLFAGGDQIYRYSIANQQWQLAASQNIIKYPLDIIVDDRGDIFVGTDDGAIFRSTDNGQQWQKLYQVESQIVTEKRVKTLAPYSNRYLFAGTGRGLLFCDLNNGNWRPLDFGYHEYVTDIEIDANNQIFISTLGKGVFRSKIQNHSF